MRPRRPRLEGKTAVITGIASGQGRAAALLFAAEGAVIVGCDMNDDGAAATVGLVRQAGGEAFSSRVGSTAGVTGSVTNGRLAHTASRRPSRWAASVRRRRWPPAPSSSPPTRPPTSLAQTS
jgi:NAD(P)-dependent dehydrogenase (short-subunit alcohol dehydrogenase family)